MVGPTCCFPLKSGMIILAFLDTLFALFAFVISVGGFVYFEIYRDGILDFFEDPPTELGAFLNLRKLGATTIRVFLSFNAFYWLQKVALGAMLMVAAIKERKQLYRIWIFYTLFLLVLSVLFFLAAIILGVAEPYSISFYVGAFLIREYTVWIVSASLKRLQYGNESQSNYSLDGDKVTYKL